MSDDAGVQHAPVMRERITELLAASLQGPAPVLLDCTLGLGGHALALLQARPSASLIGIDADADALAIAERRLHAVGDRIQLFHATYDELTDVLVEAGVPKVQAILMDLGLSSLQIDRPERGFAYAVDAPLDMRMDVRLTRTAADILNTASEAELASIFWRYGEETASRPIARAVVADRVSEPFTNSERLVRLLERVAGRPGQSRRGHPAKRVFQALRIQVNGELDSLTAALPAAIDALAAPTKDTPGGRLAVLAYHSGEDRLVKRAFRAETTSQAPRGLPVPDVELRPRLTLLTRGAEKPSDDEIAVNPRAASARLRAVQNQEAA